jgi:hypothetical protein
LAAAAVHLIKRVTPETLRPFSEPLAMFLTNDKGPVSLLNLTPRFFRRCAARLRWLSLVAEETGLQRFEPAADDDYPAVDGEQRAMARLEQVAEHARGNAVHANAPNTLKANRIDWAYFSAWCALHNLEFLPAAVLQRSPVDGRIVKCKALIRWAHPARGLLAAGAFVPMAEKTGLVVPIGEWVLPQACSQVRT